MIAVTMRMSMEGLCVYLVIWLKLHQTWLKLQQNHWRMKWSKAIVTGHFLQHVTSGSPQTCMFPFHVTSYQSFTGTEKKCVHSWEIYPSARDVNNKKHQCGVPQAPKGSRILVCHLPMPSSRQSISWHWVWGIGLKDQTQQINQQWVINRQWFPLGKLYSASLMAPGLK